MPVAPVEVVAATEPRPTEASREIRVEAPAPPPSEPATVATIAKPAIGFDAKPRAIEPMPVPPPEVNKAEVLEAIDREAERLKAKQEKLEDFKASATERQMRDAWNKAQRERAEFHAELEVLLRRLGNRAGPSIDSLCDRYGRETVPEIRNAVNRLLSRSAAGLSFEGKIELMRKYGYPEPMILDYLYQRMYRRINTPGGPRDKFEVRVLAARILLGHQDSAPSKTAAPPPLTARPGSGALSPPGPVAPRRP